MLKNTLFCFNIAEFVYLSQKLKYVKFTLKKQAKNKALRAIETFLYLCYNDSRAYEIRQQHDNIRKRTILLRALRKVLPRLSEERIGKEH